MPNEEMTKLIAALGALGYRVVSINPEKKTEDQFGNQYPTSRTILLIAPDPKP